MSELAAMVIDPLKEAHRAGIDIRLEKLEKYGMTPNALFTHTLALPWYLPSDPAIAGLVVGFRRYAWAENGIDDDDLEGERGEYAPFLSASVLAFDSNAHAREYVKWLPSRVLDQADQPVRAALPAAGKAAVLWRSGSGRHFTDVALIRRGNRVGEVVTRGFTTDGHGEAIELLARALADQMAQVRSRARPYDAAAVLAAPLPSEAWAGLGEEGSSYPELISCEVSFSECDVESMWGASWGDAPEDSSYLHLAHPDADDEADYPRTGTELIAYNSESEAADAMGDIAARWLAREGGAQFIVPGVTGAVGVRTGTLEVLDDPSEERIGYTWSVLFTHGSALARAFVAGGPSDYFGPNEQWVIDAAQAWQPRLDVILG